MAADPTVGDIFAVSFDQSLLGQRLLNTWYFRLESLGGAFPDIDTFSTDVFNYLNGAGKLIQRFDQMIPTNAFHNRTWIQRVSPTRARKRVYGIATNGTGIGAAEASNVQYSITRQDDDALKSSTGAVHIVVPPIPTTVLVGNGWSAAQQTLANAVAGQMFGSFTTAGGFICKWILYHKHPKPGRLPYSYVVVTTPQATVRVMRRRTAGVGK